MENKCGIPQMNALRDSIGLTPTDGLGITSSDVEQFGVDSYEEVDNIFHEFYKWLGDNQDNEKMISLYLKANQSAPVGKILRRHLNGEFKRKPMPKANIYL